MFFRWWWRLTLKEWPWLEPMTLKLLKHIAQVSRPRVWVLTSFQWKVSDMMTSEHHPKCGSFSFSGVVEMVTRCQSCIKISRVILAHRVGRPSPDPLQKAGNTTVSGAKSVQVLRNATQFPKCKTNTDFDCREPFTPLSKHHQTASEWPPKQLQCLPCFLDAACSSELYDHFLRCHIFLQYGLIFNTRNC